jgi:hypothetical protein
MLAGVAGVETFNARLRVELFPHAEFDLTVMFPPQNDEPINT